MTLCNYSLPDFIQFASRLPILNPILFKLTETHANSYVIKRVLRFFYWNWPVVKPITFIYYVTVNTKSLRGESIRRLYDMLNSLDELAPLSWPLRNNKSDKPPLFRRRAWQHLALVCLYSFFLVYHHNYIFILNKFKRLILSITHCNDNAKCKENRDSLIYI